MMAHGGAGWGLLCLAHAGRCLSWRAAAAAAALSCSRSWPRSAPGSLPPDAYLAPGPYRRVYRGHKQDVLDLCWSKTQVRPAPSQPQGTHARPERRAHLLGRARRTGRQGEERRRAGAQAHMRSHALTPSHAHTTAPSHTPPSSCCLPRWTRRCGCGTSPWTSACASSSERPAFIRNRLGKDNNEHAPAPAPACTCPFASPVLLLLAAAVLAALPGRAALRRGRRTRCVTAVGVRPLPEPSCIA